VKASTLARLGFAGSRTDRLRTSLTARSSALATLVLLGAATVGAVKGGGQILRDGEYVRQPGAEQYTSALLAESGLRPGVMVALLTLSLPVLALAGQCIRLGAPARDRRLAAIRLAGATPGQAVLIAAAEAAVAAVGGAVAGYGLYLILRALLHRPDAQGRLPLPTDVLPGPVTTVLVLLIVPVLAALIGALLLRRVIVGPLGVVRRTRNKGPRPWPGVLIAVGVVLFGLPGELGKKAELTPTVVSLSLSAGALLTMIGVVLGTGWISHTVGRLMLRAGRPAALLAGRRLMADPWNGSRTLAALLAGTVAGAAALGYRISLVTEFKAYDLFNAQLPNPQDGTYGLAADDDFYLGAIRLIIIAVSIGMAAAAAGALIALAESIVAGRRTYAALTATGVPRRVLAEMLLWQTAGPLVPALLLALGTGVGMARMLGTDVEIGNGALEGFGPYVKLPVPVPFGGLAVLGGGTLLAMLLVVAVGALVMRSSTDLEELRVG